MRLPGTVNIVANDLPTPHFLKQYKELKTKQRARKAQEEADKAKEEAEKPKWPYHASASKKPGDKQAEKAPTKADDAKADDAAKKDTEFTKAQDDALIELKLKDTAWKAIATELGKEVNQVKERFKIIKPDDFDKKHMEAKQAKKDDKAENKGGAGSEEKKEQPTAGGAGANEQGGKQGKKRGKQQAQQQGDEDSDNGDNWWDDEDNNWSKDDLHALCFIANEEFKDAFGRMAARLSDEQGKQVHPKSIAEKILGARPEWM